MGSILAVSSCSLIVEQRYSCSEEGLDALNSLEAQMTRQMSWTRRPKAAVDCDSSGTAGVNLDSPLAVKDTIDEAAERLGCEATKVSDAGRQSRMTCSMGDTAFVLHIRSDSRSLRERQGYATEVWGVVTGTSPEIDSGAGQN